MLTRLGPMRSRSLHASLAGSWTLLIYRLLVGSGDLVGMKCDLRRPASTGRFTSALSTAVPSAQRHSLPFSCQYSVSSNHSQPPRRRCDLERLLGPQNRVWGPEPLLEVSYSASEQINSSGINNPLRSSTIWYPCPVRPTSSVIHEQGILYASLCLPHFFSILREKVSRDIPVRDPKLG